MVTRELDTPPRILELYARALAPLVPGASRLPWVAGGGEEIPDLALSLAHVRADPARVASYRRVCAFPPGSELPATYPHVLAFPLHLALMADGDFPFAPVGLVHLANHIAQQRPIMLAERFDLRVWATPLEAHPRGRTFSLVTEARVADELVWRELSTMLHREAPTDAPAGDGAGAGGEHAGGHAEHEPGPAPEPAQAPEPLSAAAAVRAEWRLPGDLGRRYAAVSGDRNPIHLHALGARALGFPRAIIHGMWTKARCLAALQESAGGPPAAPLSVEVRFRRPIPLPSSVGFESVGEGDTVRFGVRDTSGATEHLDGHMEPLEDITRAREELR
jgi:acyl dehydratase